MAGTSRSTPAAPADTYLVRRSITKPKDAPEVWRVWRNGKPVSVRFATQLEALRCLDAIMADRAKQEGR